MEAKLATDQAAFATPDRENTTTDPSPPKNQEEAEVPSSEKANTVTPLDADDKQVRFSAEKKEDSKRGLVSRRGGRLGSPATAPRVTISSKEDGPVLEFKTFRSPQRKRDSAVENDTIPSLCSTNSGPLDRKQLDEKDIVTAGEKLEAEDATTSNGGNDKKSGRPSSISCDPSMSATTSPLASQDVDASPLGQARTTVATTPTKPLPPDGARNVTFSPPTPHSDVIDRTELPKKTPTKSPLPGQFQSLPSLHDAKLTPSGIFLEPSPPSPSAYAGLSSVPSLDKKEKADDEKALEKKKPAEPKISGGDANRKEEAKTDSQEDRSAARARDQERERAVATPTDFTLDFGKGLRPSGSFDASNVLAWLQSPTANGLFSPGGGFGSGLNTPRAATAPRTPRTPTMTTSFFFSDVASLPKNSEYGSPKGDNDGGKRGVGIGGPQGVYSSMICISPLAPKSRKDNGEPQTPVNYNDVFASPRDNRESRPNNLPFLGDSPTKRRSSAKKDGNVDAHMAERDLMEDDDLSVLLQLASHNTPGRSREGGHVFRSPQPRPSSGYPPRQNASGSNLPGLQLPVIGGRGDAGAKLSRKPGSQGGSSDDFKPPQLSIRSSSSGGSKEIYLGGLKPSAQDDKANPAPLPVGAAKGGSQKAGKAAAPKKNSRKMPAHPMPPYPYPGEQPPVSYYPMPGTMHGMPPSGSMRVVVGGPPPMPPRPKGKGSPSRNPGSPSRRPAYPMHPGQGDGRYPPMPYPPPPPHGHGGYPPPPHMAGMGMPPPHYPGHYPPPHHPPHMPMYRHHQVVDKKGKGKSKAGTKRPMTQPGKSPAKKARKSPGKPSNKRSKMSPPSQHEKQKAAGTINAVNAASGGKNDKAAALAAAILRGVTMRPSGKWQAQLYFAGKSRYIGVFDTREKAALAYEIAREKLKAADKIPNDNSAQSLKATEAAVNAARKAAFEGVNERDPRAK